MSENALEQTQTENPALILRDELGLPRAPLAGQWHYLVRLNVRRRQLRTSSPLTILRIHIEGWQSDSKANSG